MLLPALFAAVCCCLPLAAQGTQQTAVDPPKSTERTVRGACSPSQSRDLFRGCDADADDRLDVFESSDALEAVRSPRDTAGFRRLDQDRDGYVSWPEFDAALRAVLQKGGTFRVRTSRPTTPEAQGQPTGSSVQQFLQLHDSNGNGGLDTDEVTEFLRKAALPPAIVNPLRTLDHDKDGRISEAELAPWFEQLPGQGRPPTSGAASPLAPPWDTADKNHDGGIDAAELGSALRRLDPALDSWTAELWKALDRDKDGVLRKAELPGDARLPGTPAPLPKQAPVR